MADRGYAFDFVSDKQLEGVKNDGRQLETGGARYRCVLVPNAAAMKTSTVERLVELAEQGATILVWKDLPREVPGLHRSAERAKALRDLLGRLQPSDGCVTAVGKGRFVVGDDLGQLLEDARIARESMVDRELQFIRRRVGDDVHYFIANHSARAVDGWVRIATTAKSVILMDPMTGAAGVARTRGDVATEVLLQLAPGETRILRALTGRRIDGAAWPVRFELDASFPLAGEWRIEFVEGGPTLPPAITTRELKSWTDLGGDEAKRFAGAARCRIRFDLADVKEGHWLLDLGDVRESARVSVNGKPVGIVVAHPFRLEIGPYLRRGTNELVVEVTNLSANRIRDLDVRGVAWKRFHDINFVNHLYQKFDASKWELRPSGLLGPVTLQSWR